MALTESLPYGLRDVSLRPVVNGVVGAAVDLPNAQIFSFEETEEFEELRGDDRVRARRGKGASVSWSLEAGGISLEAYAILTGGTQTSTGVSPNQQKKYSKKDTDARPEFQVEGQSISESGGDFHTVLFRCKAEGKISGEQSDGTFWISKCEGSALGRLSDGTIYEFTQNETVSPISTSATQVPIIVDISPAGRSAGQQITVSGNFMSGVTGVTLGGSAVAANLWTQISNNAIVLTIPTGTTTGAKAIVVTNGVGASAAFNYTVA